MRNLAYTYIYNKSFRGPYQKSHIEFIECSLYRTELKLTVIRMYPNRMPRYKAIFCFIFKCFTKKKDGWSMYIINNIYRDKTI